MLSDCCGHAACLSVGNDLAVSHALPRAPARAPKAPKAYDAGMSVQRTDVALIGAGPIGIEMAVGLKRAGIDYLHFDAGQIGATVQWFAPGTRFFSSPERIAIAGVPLQTLDQGKATREEYLRYLR